MVNFGLLAAEICWWVWGTPGNFNRFCILAALLHGTLVVTISQTLRRWTEGAIYIWQGGHQVEHWPTFLVLCFVLTKYCSITWCDLLSNYCKSFSIGHNFNKTMHLTFHNCIMIVHAKKIPICASDCDKWGSTELLFYTVLMLGIWPKMSQKMLASAVLANNF